MRVAEDDAESVTRLVVGILAEGDDADLDGIERLHRLEDLEIQAPVRNIQRIAELQHLQRLDIWDCRNFTDFAFLDGLQELTHLRLNLVRFAQLKQVISLRNLTSLNLERWSGLTDLGPLAALSRLDTLSLTGIDLTDLSALGDFANLKTLRLEALRDLDNLSSLAPTPRLTNLMLHRLPQVRDLNSLATLTGLATLTIDEFDSLESTANDELGPGFPLDSLDDLALSPLTRLRDLKSLSLMNLRTTIDFRPLNQLPHLRQVTISNVPVTSVSAVRDVQEAGGWSWTSTEGPNYATESWTRP